ncbi:hypothetical protein [Legionella micdadei]|uniref:Uncharacterized protein n=1 Tax=Legionella micdadei TaxID=451 RepID=A0A098GJS0_LEGMI|nr:hypothetical protein [Legionella micdadei]ARG96859.1 hypothetical protein B6N58_03810 [Legionella micdadei]ARG99592.1 hypothetical protein B6V88_03720 [Legionella micdadei]KTD26541.1 hypothetical protein Lmic_2635 [Legionella micdadei]NSL17869.1 hypothetical protein [Legionella micdadei]CEG61741.1 conserved protein of unknown function [Legionella micdadei]
MSNKQLSERLNKELDAIGVPGLMDERIQICSKLFRLPKFKAEALLNGVAVDPISMEKVAEELEVSVDWLLGQKKDKKERH